MRRKKENEKKKKKKRGSGSLRLSGQTVYISRGHLSSDTNYRKIKVYSQEWDISSWGHLYSYSVFLVAIL